MLLPAICKMPANSRNRKRCGVSLDLQNVRRQRFYILLKNKILHNENKNI